MIISLKKNLFTPDINNKLYLDDRGSNSIFVMGGIELHNIRLGSRISNHWTNRLVTYLVSK